MSDPTDEPRPTRKGRGSRPVVRHRCYAVCGRGLEPFVAAEARALGAKVGRLGVGGVELELTTRQLYVANLHLATATRVIVRVATFVARSFSELEARLGEICWGEHLDPGRPVTASVRSSASQLFHTDAVAERVERVAARAAADAGRHVAPAIERQLVVVRISHDRVTVSVDSSGSALHHRGWRVAGSKAPVRSTVAAALLSASGWDPTGDAPLLDPFCGSGTIVIEAARRAAGVAAGWGRNFAFEQWPTFQPGTWASVREDARRLQRSASSTTVFGSDRDHGALAAAAANAEAAGVADRIVLRHAAVSNLGARGMVPSGPGVVVTNPPYGRRVGGEGGRDLRNLYARTGDVLRATCPGWPVALLGTEAHLVQALGLDMADLGAVDHGGLRAHVWVGRS